MFINWVNKKDRQWLFNCERVDLNLYRISHFAKRSYVRGHCFKWEEPFPPQTLTAGRFLYWIIFIFLFFWFFSFYTQFIYNLYTIHTIQLLKKNLTIPGTNFWKRLPGIGIELTSKTITYRHGDIWIIGRILKVMNN